MIWNETKPVLEPVLACQAFDLRENWVLRTPHSFDQLLVKTVAHGIVQRFHNRKGIMLGIKRPINASGSETCAYFQMSRAWRRYTKLVEQYPWGSQIVQTGVICASGDAVAQIIVERKNLKVMKWPVLGSNEHLQTFRYLFIILIFLVYLINVYWLHINMI